MPCVYTLRTFCTFLAVVPARSKIDSLVLGSQGSQASVKYKRLGMLNLVQPTNNQGGYYYSLILQAFKLLRGREEREVLGTCSWNSEMVHSDYLQRLFAD